MNLIPRLVPAPRAAVLSSGPPCSACWPCPCRPPRAARDIWSAGSRNRLYVSNPGEPDLTWSARGFVYTAVAGGPAPTIAAVVNALPHGAGLGFWARMQRGLRRLWSWINPFR